MWIRAPFVQTVEQTRWRGTANDGARLVAVGGKDDLAITAALTTANVPIEI